MTLKIQKIKGKNLHSNMIFLMNKQRKKEFGKKKSINFKKDEKESLFFFVKNKNKVVAFGMLKPIKINYFGKIYNILGFGSGIAVEKKKGYGKRLMEARISYIKKEGKTGVGFIMRKNIKFFEKCGLKIEKNLIRRFIYKKPSGEESKDGVGDGIYYEGKDGFMKKILSTKSKIYINIPFW